MNEILVWGFEVMIVMEENQVFRIIVLQCQIVQQEFHMEWPGIGTDLLGKRPRMALKYWVSGGRKAAVMWNHNLTAQEQNKINDYTGHPKQMASC